MRTGRRAAAEERDREIGTVRLAGKVAGWMPTRLTIRLTDGRTMTISSPDPVFANTSVGDVPIRIEVG